MKSSKIFLSISAILIPINILYLLGTLFILSFSDAEGPTAHSENIFLLALIICVLTGAILTNILRRKEKIGTLKSKYLPIVTFIISAAPWLYFLGVYVFQNLF